MPASHESRTTTFLMTDIEGSTRLWEEHPGAMAAALEAHDSLLREAVERANGTLVKMTGDGVLAAFDLPDRAISAAMEAQLALARGDAPGQPPIGVVTDFLRDKDLLLLLDKLRAPHRGRGGPRPATPGQLQVPARDGDEPRGTRRRR